MDEEPFDPNNVNIKYTGDEDEIVQPIEAGNIRFRFQEADTSAIPQAQGLSASPASSNMAI